jgi:hypothetical protein
MPVAQQNAVLQKYCAVCHSDALMAGGFSLQHFDAAHPDPGMATMLVSKLTSGLPVKQVEASLRDPAAAAFVADRMKTGAMGAAGLGVPDAETQAALVRALVTEGAGATQWTVASSSNPASVSASILREVLSPTREGIADSYRLKLTCRGDTHEGEIQLAWANGVPDEGHAFSLAVDGKAPLSYKAEGGAKQGNGKYGPGSVILNALPLPAQTLTVSEVFPGETIVFPFDGLTQTTRQALAPCFSGTRVP